MERIRYKFISAEINHGTDDAPDIEQVLLEKSLPYCDANEEIAKSEAYNGKYEIVDDGEPAPIPTEQEMLRADVDFLLMMMEG